MRDKSKITTITQKRFADRSVSSISTVSCKKSKSFNNYKKLLIFASIYTEKVQRPTLFHENHYLAVTYQALLHLHACGGIWGAVGESRTVIYTPKAKV